MGFWDWANTAREGVQGAIPKIGEHIWGGLTTGNPTNTATLNPQKGALQEAGAPTLISNLGKGGGGGGSPVKPGPQLIQWLLTPAGQQFAAQNGISIDPNTGELSATGALGSGQIVPVPKDPNAAQQWNPLAINMFYNQTVAPMLKQLAGQFQGNDAMLQQLTNSPGQQYLSPQQKAMTDMMNKQIGLENSQVSEALLGAAAAGPAIDTLNQQMGTLSQRALQAYTEALRQGQSSGLQSIFGSTTPNTGDPVAAAAAAAVQAATQPTG